MVRAKKLNKKVPAVYIMNLFRRTAQMYRVAMYCDEKYLHTHTSAHITHRYVMK